MATMIEIEQLAMKMAAARDALAGTYMECQEETDAIHKQYVKRIVREVKAFQAASEEMSRAVAESPGLFVKPKSVILFGIKAGFQKGKGKLEWEDDEQVCKLIRKHQPDLAAVLIKTTETPVKGALNELAAVDLRKLGIVVEETGDVPFVKLADTEIAKTIKALLKDKGSDE